MNLAEPPLPEPKKVRAFLSHLAGQRAALASTHREKANRLREVQEYLAISKSVEAALDLLSEQLFGRIVEVIEQKLSLALQEILEQPIALKVTRDFKRGVATMGFYIERNGQSEDIMRGQGGSVANVLSVGLRMFALTTLDQATHRRFLVLDEQDCWLRPDLVPRLVKIVHQAGKALGFQVVMISHHDVSSFEQFADKIYEFKPTVDGVQVIERTAQPEAVDEV